jgi:hypothetical protein
MEFGGGGKIGKKIDIIRGDEFEEGEMFTRSSDVSQ